MAPETSHTIANRFQPFGTTIFSEMTALAKKHQAVNLSQGFPDFDGPDIGKHAAIEAIKNHHNQYAPMPGIPVLREAIARWTQRHLPFEYNPETEITVTSGCTEAIAATMLGLLNPGDEVIIFEPFYDSYRACLAMAGANAKFVTIKPGHDDSGEGFGFSQEDVEHAFSSKTKAILINTPHNPTGMVLTQQQLQHIAELCIKHDVIAISDEVYERLIYDQHTHISIASIPGMRERTVVLSSIGKTFSFTGWKVGWAVAPPRLTSGIRAAHQFLIFSVATPLQFGAAELLNHGEEDIVNLVDHYASMRSLLSEALSDIGFHVYIPQGSYFIMADHTSLSSKLRIKDDIEFCTWLPTHTGVAAIPPSAFYDKPSHGSKLVRFAFCKKKETIQHAIERLRSAF